MAHQLFSIAIHDHYELHRTTINDNILAQIFVINLIAKKKKKNQRNIRHNGHIVLFE